MVMDMFGAIALATEPPNMSSLAGRPIKKFEKIMNNVLWRTILSQAIWVTIWSLIMLYAAPAIFDLYVTPSPIYDEATKSYLP